MEVKFVVHDLPPKKDGANSMWRKGTELPRLKALRVAALEAWGDAPLLMHKAGLEIIVYADPRAGDLDNFITGICDGLMAAHSLTPIDDQAWIDIPSEGHPRKAIALSDDSIVERIVAERRHSAESGSWYEVISTGN